MTSPLVADDRSSTELAPQTQADAIEVAHLIGVAISKLCERRAEQGAPPIEPFACILGTAMALGFATGFYVADPRKAETFLEQAAELGKHDIAKGQRARLKAAEPRGRA